jgi:multidrug efflux pump
VLTLVITPSMLAIRVWATTYVQWIATLLAKMSMGRASRAARDWALERDAARIAGTEIIWTDETAPQPDDMTLRAAE